MSRSTSIVPLTCSCVSESIRFALTNRLKRILVYTREGSGYLGVCGYTLFTVSMVMSSVSVEYIDESNSSATLASSSLLSALMPVLLRFPSKSEYTVSLFTLLLGLA